LEWLKIIWNRLAFGRAADTPEDRPMILRSRIVNAVPYPRQHGIRKRRADSESCFTLEVPPPRTGRFGSPLVLSGVHWVRPELVTEVKYLTWTDDNVAPGRL